MIKAQNPISAWRGMAPRARSEAMTFYLWISPWLVGFLVWQAWPLIRSLYLSFTNFRLLNAPEWSGTANIERLLEDDIYWKSVRVTVLYVLGAVPVGTLLALAVAMILAQQLRGVNWWRTIYFLPSIVAGVSIAVMWSFIFNPDFGLFNVILEQFGIKGPGWLISETWALPAIVIIAWWQGLGTQMVIYLAGLKGIPQTLYEAAEIDGAGQWAKFINVTVPMLSPTIFFNMIVQLIGAFQTFDVPFVMTDGGPNNATRVYVFGLYEQAFINQNMGYASLMAWVLFLIILALTGIMVWTSQRWVYYETGVN